MAQIGNRFSQYKGTFYHQVEVNEAIAAELSTYTLSSIKPIQPWHWRKLPLAKLSGAQVFEALFLNPRGETSNPQTETLQGRFHPRIATLLESPVTPNTHLARYSICAGSPRLIEGQQRLWTPPLGDILPFLRCLLNSHQDKNARMKAESIVPAELPFTGGWLGWLGYDLAWEIEQLPQHKVDPLPFPIAYWYEPESFAVADHQQQILWLAATDLAQLDLMQSQLEQADEKRGTQNLPPFHKTTPVNPVFQMSEEDYMVAVQQADRKSVV